MKFCCTPSEMGNNVLQDLIYIIIITLVVTTHWTTDPNWFRSKFVLIIALFNVLVMTFSKMRIISDFSPLVTMLQ